MFKKVMATALPVLGLGVILASPFTQVEATEVAETAETAAILSEYQGIAPFTQPGVILQARFNLVHFANGNVGSNQGQINTGARIQVISGPHGTHGRWRVRVQNVNGHNGWANQVVYFNAAAFNYMAFIGFP